MAEDEWALNPNQHQRTIVHIDVDCFYAQVEMVRDPNLRDKPLGIKQKNLMVTSNYVARSMGVKKSMWIKDALKILPNLLLVDGSDLTHYRQFSAEISGVAQTYTPNVERLGLDENFLDISDIVTDYIKPEFKGIEGHVYGDKVGENVLGDPCGCGCLQRLTAGTHMAKKLRQHIFETTGITCCAGVAHNKLLAKLVSGYYKPNQQTVVFPWQVYDVMKSLNQAKSIPGIGSTTYRTLEDLGISTVEELQNANLNILNSGFDKDTSNRLKDLSYGMDVSAVRKSGRPQSIGLEDAFRKVSSIAEVRIKYNTLLERLLKLLAEDGRVPGVLKVSVRKFHKQMRFGQRETKQIPVSASLFSAGTKSIPEKSKIELMNAIMNLFHKMVNTTEAYHLTLLGVGFTKFLDRGPDGMSISDFFSKSMEKRNRNDSVKKLNSPKTVKANEISDSKSMTLDVRLRDDSQDSSDEEDYHKPFEKYIEGTANQGIDTPICGIKFKEKNEHLSDNTTINSIRDQLLDIPSEIDKDVFRVLPAELQSEILKSYQSNSYAHQTENKKNSNLDVIGRSQSVKDNSCKKRSLDKFLISQDKISAIDNKKLKFTQIGIAKTSELNIDNSINLDQPSCSKVKCIQKLPSSSIEDNEKVISTLEENKNSLLVDKGIDLDVFNSLPKDLQDEILGEQSMKKPVISPHKFVKSKNKKMSYESASILKYFKKS